METYNNGSPTPEFNNAGQIFNHDFYWESISPEKRERPWPLPSTLSRTAAWLSSHSLWPWRGCFDIQPLKIARVARAGLCLLLIVQKLERRGLR